MALISLSKRSVAEVKASQNNAVFNIGPSKKTGAMCFCCGNIAGAVAENIDYNGPICVSEVKDPEKGTQFFILGNDKPLTELMLASVAKTL